MIGRDQILISQAFDKLLGELRGTSGNLTVVAPEGYGKSYFANYLIEQMLSDEFDNLQNFGRLLVITLEPKAKEISISQIRALTKSLSRKDASGGARIVFIENAQLMSREAQNALLKILEEPPKDTRFILTATKGNALLPTIISRTQLISLKPVSEEEAITYFSGKYPAKTVSSVWNLTEGAPGEMANILQSGTDNADLIEQAKQFIAADKYERLLLVDQLGKDSESLSKFIETLSRVLRALQRGSIKKSNTLSQRQLESRRLCLELVNMLDTNTSTKLVSLKLVSGFKV